jgi:protein-disulfide isomerase
MEHNTPESQPGVTSTHVQKRESLAVPIAIVIAAGLIAGAIYMSGGAAPAKNQVADTTPEEDIVFRPVDQTDHIRGNPNAPILFVEYSDYDCPFCKQFHDTMNRIMAEYGQDGKVAWAYRHLPLEQLHPNAPKIAAAAECVADNAGNDAFWRFSDRVFAAKTPQEQTDMSRITEYAVEAGADRGAFELCYSSGKMAEKIAAGIEEAARAGARGTPHTFIIVGSDQKTVINGAQPYSVIKTAIDNILGQLEGKKLEQ